MSINLPQNQIFKILENWKISEFEQERISRGESTHNWMIRTRNGNYILRNAGSDRDHIDFQNFILKELHNYNLSYSTPIPIEVNNSTYLELGKQFYVLYKFIDGEILDHSFKKPLAKDIGILVAKYHQAVSKIDYGFKKVRKKSLFDNYAITCSLQKSAEIIKRKRNKHQVDELFLLNLNTILQTYNNIPLKDIEGIKQLDRIPCHCDLNIENIILQSGKIVGLIDFGGISVEPRLFDFQNAVVYIAGSSGRIDYPKMDAFVRGYFSVWPISASEITFMYSLMLADLALTLSWIFEQRRNENCRVKNSEAMFRINLFDWLIKHDSEFRKWIERHS